MSERYFFFSPPVTFYVSQFGAKNNAVKTTLKITLKKTRYNVEKNAVEKNAVEKNA